MLIPKFADLPVWLQITAPLIGWFATYPTTREKTRRGQRVRLVFMAGSLIFVLLFLHPSLAVTGVLVGSLALDGVLLFLSFRKQGAS
jgi:hypothetical protein